MAIGSMLVFLKKRKKKREAKEWLIFTAMPSQLYGTLLNNFSLNTVSSSLPSQTVLPYSIDTSSVSGDKETNTIVLFESKNIYNILYPLQL